MFGEITVQSCGQTLSSSKVDGKKEILLEIDGGTFRITVDANGAGEVFELM